MAVWNTIKKNLNLLPFQQRPTFLHGNLLENTHNAYHHTLRHLRCLIQMLIHSPGSETQKQLHTSPFCKKFDSWSLGHHGLIYLNLFDCFTFIGSKAIDCCGFPIAGRSFWILSTSLRMSVRPRTTNMTMKKNTSLKTYLLLKKRDFPLPMLVFRSVPPVLIDFPFRTWWFVGNVFEWTASHWKSRISVKSDFCFICWFLWHFLSLMELGSLSIFITKLPTMKQRGSIYESQESTQPHRYPDILTRPFFSSPFSPVSFLLGHVKNSGASIKPKTMWQNTWI